MNMKFMQWCSRAVYSYQQANIWIVSYQGVFSGLNDIQDEFSIENLNLGKWLLPPLPGLCCVPLNSNSSSKNVPVSTKFHTLLTRQDLAVCWSQIWAQNNSNQIRKKLVSHLPPSYCELLCDSGRALTTRPGRQKCILASSYFLSLSRPGAIVLSGRKNSNYKYRRRNKSGGDTASDLSSADEYFIARRQTILQSLELEAQTKSKPSLCPPCQCSHLAADSNSSSCSSTAPLLTGGTSPPPAPPICSCKRINCLKCCRSPSATRKHQARKISGQNVESVTKCQHQGTVKQNFLN